jgi:hypothetical protein
VYQLQSGEAIWIAITINKGYFREERGLKEISRAVLGLIAHNY